MTSTQPSLQQHTVLITGSSRGIGKAIAEMLAEAGYSVVLHCREQRSAVDQLAQRIVAEGGNARVLQFDVADRAACAEILSDDITQHGAYYGVVCNAGVVRDAAFPAMTGEQWDNVIHTNLDGFYNVLHPLIMPMVRRRSSGRIVTIASVSGLMGNRGQTNYSAAKAGLMAASKSLALELAKREITVNCVAPGLIDTDMSALHAAEHIMEMIPARRVGEAREVAALVKFLLSADAAYITRQVIAINGGMC